MSATKPSMHLIWKRPDGFHGASPADFTTIDLGQETRLWVHKTDKDQYPFKISGSWEENEATVRLNNLVNLVPEPKKKWVDHLINLFSHTMKDNSQEFFNDLMEWLNELQQNIKGDSWEVEILKQSLAATEKRLLDAKDDFLKSSKG